MWRGGGLTWTYLFHFDFTGTHLDSLESAWTHLDPLGLTWTHLDSLDLTREKGKDPKAKGKRESPEPTFLSDSH